MNELQLKLLWSNLFGIRFMLVILPQYGLVSIEEFTESPKQMSGILGIASDPEYDTREPVLFPFLTSGIPFLVLRLINDLGIFGHIITPYTVLVVPRIWMTFCSIAIDMFVYKTAINVGCRHKTALTAAMLLSSSYVTWVYFTRTLPISINAVLLSILLYAITKSMKESSERGNKFDAQNTLKVTYLILLGTHIDFNFIPLIFIPVLIWTVYPKFSIKICFCRAFVFFTMAILLPFSLCIFSEAAKHYHDHRQSAIFSFDTLKCLHQSFLHENRKTFTEFENFGSIPSKIIASSALLFTTLGPLIIPLYDIFCKMCLPSIYSCDIHDIVLCGSFIGIFIVSCVTKLLFHNFFLPLIVPFVVLIVKHCDLNKKLVISFCIFNISAFMYNGIYVYGGATHSMDFLGSVGPRVRHFQVENIIYYQTPVLPKYLMALGCHHYDKSGVCVTDDNFPLNFYEIDKVDVMFETLNDLLPSGHSQMLFLMIPGSVPCAVVSKLNMLYNLQLFYKCFPHITSAEYIPDYSNLQEWCSFRYGHIDTMTDLVYEKFSLNIFRVSRAEAVNGNVNIVEEAKKITLLLDNYSIAM